MSQPTTNSAGTVVVDANVLIAISSKEPACQTAETAMSDYAVRNWAFYAPGAILTEGLFVLCRKRQDGLLSKAEYEEALNTFSDYLQGIRPSPQGDIGFIRRAAAIRQGYSCLHCTDAFYIALAEALAQSGPAELLTFDKRLVNVAARNAPSVKVNLLPS